MGLDARLGSDLEELDPIIAREVGDGEQLPLFPEYAVGKGRNIRHVNAGADHPSAFAHRP